jgi:DNA-binding NarL/FixJ family response regulator
MTALLEMDQAVSQLPANPVRVLLVDPRLERRQVLKVMIEGGATTASVVGEAGSRDEAVSLVAQLAVDVVVLEIQMPVEEGLLTVAEIRRRSPSVSIVVCSFVSDAGTRARALQAGADAFVKKPINGRELVASLNEWRVRQ